jgi:hypothetical protein
VAGAALLGAAEGVAHEGLLRLTGRHDVSRL